MDDDFRAPGLSIYGHVGFDLSTVRGETVRSLGGAAYYSALAATRTCSTIGLASVIGSDFPLADLKSLGIDCSGVRVVSGASAKFYVEYDNQYEVSSFASDLGVCRLLRPSLLSEMTWNRRAFFVATAPPSQQAEVLSWITERHYGGLIAIDTTLPYLREFRLVLDAFGDDLDVVFLNELEHQDLGWLPRGRQRLVVKHGSLGASLYEEGSRIDFPAPHVDRVSTTTGAGDVLAGAFLGELAEGGALHPALATGVALASLSVRESGVEHLRVPLHRGRREEKGLAE